MNTKQPSLGNSKLTLELLWKRIRQRGDLPGFSRVIGAILGAMRGEDDREFNMTKTVLEDPALTQKVLRLANSAMYAMFGQGINTVSKAIIVLGTDSIGHLALGLKLIDGLSSISTDSAAARKEMDKAVLASHIARHMASSASTRDAEEAVVCSMMHNLGRMMATFYLSDMWSLAQARCAEPGVDEDQAMRDVFGFGLDEMSRAVARQWGLPPTLIESLRDMPPHQTDEPLEHADWLAAMSTMSARCAEILCEGGTRYGTLSDIVTGYADMLGLEPDAMLAALEQARHSAAEDAVFTSSADVLSGASALATIPLSAKPADSTLILTSGLADMREASANARASQLMAMALETVYQGLGLSRAIAFLRDPDRG
ncbi:MAG: GAF domain-containing protein, partial [Rhodocyclaceae bacterium]|nr:GAF domain-containing protein [Rhodocyclaceae bacterium]